MIFTLGGEGKLTLYIINKYSMIFRAITESCLMIGLVPVYLDFYIAKYPTDGAKGPFIFCYNENMKKFATDNNIKLSNNFVYSEEYLAYSIQKYNYEYKKIWKSSPAGKSFSTNLLSDSYFHIYLLLDWLAKYLKYENIPNIIDENCIDKLHSNYILSKLTENKNSYNSIKPYMKNQAVSSVSAIKKTHTVDLIQKLIAYTGAKSYLEIGVWKGNTFLNIEIPHKTAVDPDFKFDTKLYAQKNTYFFDCTSNDFFQQIKFVGKEIYNEDMKYDIVFLDGFHQYEQTIIDFINTLAYSKSSTIWIIDDTVPSDPYSSLAEKNKCYQYRRLAGLKSGDWHGDVYKCIFTIHDYFLEYSYCTVIGNGNPQTIVWKANSHSKRKPIFKSLNDIKNMNYFDFLDNYQFINPVYYDNIIEYISSEKYETQQIQHITVDEIIPKIL